MDKNLGFYVFFPLVQCPTSLNIVSGGTLGVTFMSTESCQRKHCLGHCCMFRELLDMSLPLKTRIHNL